MIVLCAHYPMNSKTLYPHVLFSRQPSERIIYEIIIFYTRPGNSYIIRDQVDTQRKAYNVSSFITVLLLITTRSEQYEFVYIISSYVEVFT